MAEIKKVAYESAIESREDCVIVRRLPWMTDQQWSRISADLLERGWERG